MSERAWSKADLLCATEDLTCQSLQQFIPFLFSQLRLEFLVHGNVTQDVRFVPIDSSIHFAFWPFPGCRRFIFLLRATWVTLHFVSLQQAVELVDIVENGVVGHFSTKPLLPCQLIRDREFQLNDGKAVSIKSHRGD
jgi:insulysin